MGYGFTMTHLWHPLPTRDRSGLRYFGGRCRRKRRQRYTMKRRPCPFPVGFKTVSPKGRGHGPERY